jgi:hypothetical protein
MAVSGSFTLQQQLQALAAGNWPFGGPFNYVEDVFSTYLYTGNGTTQTITNGIDLSTKGGMVWQKDRTSGSTDNIVCDTAQGINGFLTINNTSGSVNNGGTDAVYAFNNNGFSTGTTNGFNINLAGDSTVSWTFAKQPKFFDIQTWTGDGTNRTIAHNLGSIPGMIIVKRTDTSGEWQVYHRSLANTQYLVLRNTAAVATGTDRWNSTTATSTVFSLGTATTVNASGGTYIAYIFAHDAGGFGLTGTDNVISCGSFTTDGSGNATVSLGYEPQWILYKSISAGQNWVLGDVMRGWNANSTTNMQIGLRANSSQAENATLNTSDQLTATGFNATANNVSNTYIYMAIRRPMKVPTDATTVFSSSANKPNSAGDWSLTTFVDLMLMKTQSSVQGWYWKDRLRGANSSGTINLNSADTSSESTYGNPIGFERNVNFLDDYYGPNGYAGFGFKRASGFMDIVCYTGVGYPTALNNAHNLGAVPEMMIVKNRSNTQNWFVYHAAMGNNQEMYLNQTTSQQLTNFDWNSTTPSATTFTVNSSTNNSGQTYVAYLFATCPGVSKVGSYTGTGATQTINCGFTGGARFVLIKRTDSTGAWYVWDTARGMVSGTDPSLLLNSTAAEVNANSVYTATTGFQIVSTAAGINASGGTYIFLAIA